MMFGIGTGIGRCASAIKPDVCVANHDARGARNQMGSLFRYKHRMKKDKHVLPGMYVTIHSSRLVSGGTSPWIERMSTHD